MYVIIRFFYPEPVARSVIPASGRVAYVDVLVDLGVLYTQRGWFGVRKGSDYSPNCVWGALGPWPDHKPITKCV